MKTKNPELTSLLDSLREGIDSRPPDEWIRISMDSGGIAAGADGLLSCFENACCEAGVDLPILRTGSYGYAFADPVVEIKTKAMGATVYAAVSEELVPQIVQSHILDHRLLDDHVLATRCRATELTGPVSTVLLQDTSPGGGDKTRFFQESLQDALRAAHPEHEVPVVRAYDCGLYEEGMVVQLLPSGLTYTNVLARDIIRIVQSSILSNEVLDDLLHTEPDKQERIVLRNCGRIDPESIEDALRQGAYTSLAATLASREPMKLIEIIQASGLRGRGGAGFPTGTKWKLTRQSEADRKFIICNGDEGDPGAFMDRSVLESDPHAVLEGLILAGYAIRADTGFFYIRAEYPLAVHRVQKALAAARKRGLLGKNILGSGWDFDAEIRLGAGAFVCGEETALIASIEGRRGSPEPRPPYPSVNGLWGKPTCINNVETLAAVPWIVEKGAEAYARHGTDTSRGTKVFAVTGKVKHAQLVEVPMGTTVREIVFGICGGVQDDVPIKGVQTGGPSGGIIPDGQLDTPITYENLQALGSIMGSGGMLVMDANDCMVDVAAFYLKFCVDESCGKCAPCRVGGYQMLQFLLNIKRGRGTPDDLLQINRICSAMRCASLCGLGQTAPNPILSSLRYFKDEFDAYIEGGISYARKRKKALAGEPAPKASAPISPNPSPR